MKGKESKNLCKSCKSCPKRLGFSRFFTDFGRFFAFFEIFDHFCANISMPENAVIMNGQNMREDSREVRYNTARFWEFA